MSFIKEIEKSVDNGLEIAQFIQNNRETIQETYGRSTIEKPTSRERIRAWEEFIAEKNKSDTGPEREPEGAAGNGDESTESSEVGDRNSTDEISPPDILISESSGSGDNSPRYDSNLDISDQMPKLINQSISQDDFRRGNTNTDRVGEPENSRRGHSGSTEQDTGPSNEEGDGKPTPTHKNLKRTIAIKETTEEDLKEMMEEANTEPSKRVQNIDEISESVKEIRPAPRSVKKTTGRNSPSIPSGEKQSLDNGAIQCVPESPRNQEYKPVSVESVRKPAPTVTMDTINEEVSDTSDLGTNDSSLQKLDEILMNQKKILDKLAVLTEMKEEIMNIKKVITNHGIALSTIEGYISDLMIVIPKSGQETDNSELSLNPDLRMVIGRDHSRGKAEVIKKSAYDDKIQINEDMFIVPELDPSYSIKHIDMKVNNASNFVPSDDLISISIIKGIVETEVGDPDLIDQLYDLIDAGSQSMSVKDMYKHIRRLLDDMHITDSQNSKVNVKQ